tara:strand:+ start:10906 stop:11952 length:1047 start_codon:yes stop_codon:yes gene_type:complete
MHEQALIQKECTVKQAIEGLNESGLRILLVVNEEDELLGTVTDGDIRRAILTGISVENKVTDIMNKNPIYVKKNEQDEVIKSLMIENNILSIPVLENGKVIDLKVSDIIIKTQKIPNTVVLMAGGYGKRLEPLTKKTPKPLIHVGNKPILEIIIEKFKNEGFYNFYISTFYKSEMVKDHFQDGSKWNININYIEENMPLGTCGSLSLLKQEKIQSPIIMMNCDVLTKLNFSNLLAFHKKNNNSVTSCITEYYQQIPYGVCEIEDQKVVKLTEKPVHNFFINAGIYVINEDIIRSLNENKPIDMTDIINREILNEKNVGAFPIHEYWIDIGRKDDLSNAKEIFKSTDKK